MCQKKFAGITLWAIHPTEKASQMPSNRHQRDPPCCRSLEPESFSRKVASRKHVSFSSICRNNLVQKNRIAGELAGLHLSTLAVASISLTIVPGERVSHLPTYFRPTAYSPLVDLR
jgi:hypothetical protein